MEALAETPRKTKGERTAERILDAAETLFAERGFEAASLREIARVAGIREPGVYNHFASKQRLYEAVLDRALTPMVDAMQSQMRSAGPRKAHTELPSVMTDLLLDHPKMAALFQQALQGDPQSVGTRLIRRWLDRLFGQGLDTMEEIGFGGMDRRDLAVHIIAMFNLTTGYFLSQRALESMGAGNISDPENVARHKKLLERLVRGALRG